MEIQKDKIKNIFNKFTKRKHIHEATLFIENTNGDFSYHLDYRKKNIDTAILTASITKLFTSACIFKLREQGKLSLENKITEYFDKDTWKNLHIYKGKEYSEHLTISHLLFHVSGLSDDIKEGSKESKTRALYEDTSQSFTDLITQTKETNPPFAPNQGKRAYYANINYDILGKIIEIITDCSLENVYKEFIFDPLKLQNTYLPIDDDYVPNVYYKNMSFYKQKTVKSLRASGGCISTTRELMVFTKAFFKGKLFNERLFQELGVSNKLQLSMSPIQYSAGYMKIPLDGLATLFMGHGTLVGHSGSTGSFAFYHPTSDLFLVGDLNQMANPALPVRLAMQLAMSVKGRATCEK